MSGGVDSSVSAALLKEAGHEVIGVTMHLWCEEKRGVGARKKACCSREDIRDAQEVCRMLDIPHYVMNFEQEFQDRVVDYFLREYGSGRTPNPCLACNQHIKFDLLLNRILALGGDCLATGHYARIRRDNEVFSLLTAADAAKDQSYVLYTLKQRELGHLMFPVGDYSKDRVRQIARERGLPVAVKPDSQEICFVAGKSYASFVSDRSLSTSGQMVTRDGRVLGSHRGLAFYTVGQRHGLGIGSPRPLYVLRLDPGSNRVIVGEEEDLYQSTLTAGGLSWTSGSPPATPLAVTAKIRYKAEPAPATLTVTGNVARVEFERPQRAITPGQAVVFYNGDVVLGGGIIEA